MQFEVSRHGPDVFSFKKKVNVAFHGALQSPSLLPADNHSLKKALSLLVSYIVHIMARHSGPNKSFAALGFGNAAGSGCSKHMM